MDEPDEVGGLTGRVAGIPGRHANLHVSRLGADCTRNRARDRQLGPLPCIEAADNVDDIRVPGSLQQEFRDRDRDDGSDYGRTIGLTQCILNAVAIPISVIPFVGICGSIMSLVAFVLSLSFG